MECACTLAALRGHRTWKVYDWGGGGGGVGWDNNVHARLRNYVMLRWWNVLARWQLYVVTAHGKYMIGGVGGWGGIITSMHACGTMWCYVDGMCLHAGSSTWSPHMESIWLGGVGGWGGIITSMHACGTMWCYKLIVVGTISKKIAPVKWRTALAQQSMRGSGIESINGSIATTCPSER